MCESNTNLWMFILLKGIFKIKSYLIETFLSFLNIQECECLSKMLNCSNNIDFRQITTTKIVHMKNNRNCSMQQASSPEHQLAHQPRHCVRGHHSLDVSELLRVRVRPVEGQGVSAPV